MSRSSRAATVKSQASRRRSDAPNDTSQNAADLQIPLSDHEKAIIQALAGGDQSRRDEAIAIHRKHCRSDGPRHGDPYFRFMSEIDNPKPNLMARIRSRFEVLGKEIR